MKRVSKRLATLLVMLLLLLSLLLSPPTAQCVDKFCDNCEAMCTEDYWNLIADCVNGGDSLLVCQIRHRDFIRNCGVVFCPVCPFAQ